MISNIINIFNTINVEINNKILLDIQTELLLRSLIKTKFGNKIIQINGTEKVC